jgi:probable phosphoglycerate mutase
MKFYFIRHGESEANVLGEFSNSGTKHPLTERGRSQARDAARSLSGLKIAKVYSSPVLRAVQTAKVIARSLDAPLEITEALREWSVGDYEGTRDPVGWALHRQVVEDWLFHDRLDSRMPGGESLLDIRARFIPFIDGLLNGDAEPDRQLVLVGHGGLYLAMLPEVIRNVDQAFALQHLIPYTGIVVAETRKDGLWCLSWCGLELE